MGICYGFRIREYPELSGANINGIIKIIKKK